VDGLTPTQDAAIVALLSKPTVEAAAKSCKVSRATLFNWMAESVFKAAYREARKNVLDANLSQLSGLVGEAIGTLRRNLSCETPAAEVRAAVAILDKAIAAQGLADLAAEVEELRAELGRLNAERDGPTQRGEETPRRDAETAETGDEHDPRPAEG
jgi:hypothetical protein